MGTLERVESRDQVGGGVIAGIAECHRHVVGATDRKQQNGRVTPAQAHEDCIDCAVTARNGDQLDVVTDRGLPSVLGERLCVDVVAGCFEGGDDTPARRARPLRPSRRR